MKKITLELPDVDVKLIRFVSHDDYESFSGIDGRKVESVESELDEIEKIRRQKPVAFARQSDGTYLVVTQRSEVCI